MSRMTLLTPAELKSEQLRVYEAIGAGPRGGSIASPSGGLMGPFNAWLRSPGLADPAQKLGAFLRFQTTLPARLSELAILITARHWSAQFEWHAHEPLARKGGLAPEIIAAIKARQRPPFANDDEELVYDFCTAVYETRGVDERTYKAAVAAFGEQGVVELVGLLGYYAFVSMTLNVFEAPLPDGVAPPLSD